jgi:hypothetical protein
MGDEAIPGLPARVGCWALDSGCFVVACWALGVLGDGLTDWFLGIEEPADENGELRLVDRSGVVDGPLGKPSMAFQKPLPKREASGKSLSAAQEVE